MFKIIKNTLFLILICISSCITLSVSTQTVTTELNLVNNAFRYPDGTPVGVGFINVIFVCNGDNLVAGGSYLTEQVQSQTFNLLPGTYTFHLFLIGIVRTGQEPPSCTNLQSDEDDGSFNVAVTKELTIEPNAINTVTSVGGYPGMPELDLLFSVEPLAMNSSSSSSSTSVTSSSNLSSSSVGQAVTAISTVRTGGQDSVSGKFLLLLVSILISVSCAALSFKIKQKR